MFPVMEARVGRDRDNGYLQNLAKKEFDRMDFKRTGSLDMEEAGVAGISKALQFRALEPENHMWMMPTARDVDLRAEPTCGLTQLLSQDKFAALDKNKDGAVCHNIPFVSPSMFGRRD